MADRDEREKARGQKARGQKPEPPTPKGPQAKDQVNLTDAESRTLPTAGNIITPRWKPVFQDRPHCLLMRMRLKK